MTHFGDSVIGETPLIVLPLRGWSWTKLRQLASLDSSAYKYFKITFDMSEYREIDINQGVRNW